MSQRGFTLIEVLVALGIVAIALMAGLQATAALTRNAQRQTDVLLAQTCAENELIKIRLASRCLVWVRAALPVSRRVKFIPCYWECSPRQTPTFIALTRRSAKMRSPWCGFPPWWGDTDEVAFTAAALARLHPD